MSQNTEISTPVEKSLSNLMENNYLFDKSFNKKVTNEPDYNTFIKPIGGLGPKQVTVSTPEPEEVEDNYPEVLKNTNTNSEANPIFAHMNQQPQMFPGFPQQGFPQQGFPQQGFPQQLFPQQGVPQQGPSQQLFPQQGVPIGLHQQGMPSFGLNPYLVNNNNGVAPGPQGFQGMNPFGQNPFSGVNREDLPEFLQSILDDTPEYLRP